MKKVQKRLQLKKATENTLPLKHRLPAQPWSKDDRLQDNTEQNPPDALQKQPDTAPLTAQESPAEQATPTSTPSDSAAATESSTPSQTAPAANAPSMSPVDAQAHAPMQSGGSSATPPSVWSASSGWNWGSDAQSFKSLAMLGGGLLLLAGAGGGGGSGGSPGGVTPPPPVNLLSGTGIDGYIAHALVWRDLNGDGAWNPGEDYTFTDAKGDFSGLTGTGGTIRLTGLAPDLRAVLVGTPSEDTVDISTGQAFTGVLSAPDGAAVITPLTSLIAAAMAANPDVTAEQAQNNVLASLGISQSAGVDLLNFDPLATAAATDASTPAGQALMTATLEVQKAALQVANLLKVAQEAASSAGVTDMAAVSAAVSASIASAAASGQALDFSDPDLIGGALTAVQNVVLQEHGNTPEALLAVAVLQAQQATIQAAIVSVNQSLDTLIDNAVSNLTAPSGSVNIGALFTDVAATQIVAQQNVAAQVSNSVLLAVQTGDTTSTGQVSVNVDQAMVAARSQVGTIFVPSASTAIALAVDNNGRSSYSATQTSWSGISGNVLTNDLTPDGYQTRVDLIATGNEPGTGAQSIATGAGVTLIGTYGTLVIASDGSFTYTVNASNSALLALAPNQNLSETFTYRLAASNGTQSLSDLGTLTLVLDKTNLAPIVGVATINLLDPNTAGGTSVNVVDLLSGAIDPESDPLTVQGLPTDQPIQGEFGVLAWNAGLGKWTYTIDPANPAVHVLKFGQTVHDIFTYSVTDGVNAGINTAAIIYIHGFNDAPILSKVSNATVTDTVANDTLTDITGTLAAIDLDGDPVSYVLAGSNATTGVVDFDVQKVSAYGTFLLNTATGAYKFVVNNAAVQALKTTQTATFDVSATDGLLSSSTQTITVTLNGVNDAPVPVGYSNTIALNQSLTISTLVTGSRDPEGDSFSLTAATLRSGYTGAGTVSINNGSVVFTPTSNFSGQVYIDYTLTDSGLASSQGQISLWVGSNTAPTAANGTLSTPESTALVLQSADFGFADVDAGQSLSAVQIMQLPVHGQLLLDGVAVTLNQTITQALIAAGKLSFVPEANANGTGYASLGFKVLDSGGLASSSSYTLTLDVTPVNHAPVIDAVTSTTVAETAVNDVFSDITGTLTGSDPDGNTVSYQLAGSSGTLQSGFTVEKTSTYGTFYLNTTTGAYKFVVDNAAVQALKSAQTISFDVNAFDGSLASTAKTLNITFDGVNDAPTLSTVSHATVTDTVANDTFADITGNLVGSDRDGDTVSFNLSGSSASQALGFDLEKTSTYGTFYLNTATGAYKFVVNDAAVEALKTTQTATFDVSATDGTALSASQTITVTFNGVNDAPILSAVSNATVTDTVANDTFADITGTLSATDPENDTVSYTLSGSSASLASGFSVEKASAYGTFYLNTTTGAYKFVVNDAAVEALKSSATASFDVSATDGSAASTARTLTITFNGANDSPILSAVSNATVTDTVANDTFTDITGTLAAIDLDGDAVSYVLTGSSATTGMVDFDVQKVSTYGTFLLNTATGAYKFVVNNAAVQALKTTQTATFDVSATDGLLSSSTQTITVTLNGVNDAPVAVDYSNTIAINQSLTISTLVTGSSDPEGDSFSLTAATLRSGYTGAGTVSINSGSVVFTPTSNFSGQVFIDYTLTDSGSASSQGQISLWVGTNTAPTAADKTLTTLEDTSLVLTTGDFGFSDVDTGQSLSAVQITQLPEPGQLLLDGVAVTLDQTIDQSLIAAGKLSFVPEANANGAGYASVAFKVVDSGGLASSSSYTLTLDVTAVNDAPTLNAVSNATVTDTAANDTFADITGTLVGADVDANTLHYQLTGSSATTGMVDFDVQKVSDYGTFYLNTGSGAYKFVVNDAAVEALKATATAVFGVSVSDGDASSASQNITITFNGVNDAPMLSTVSNATVNDTVANDTFADITGTLAATDRDGDVVSYALSEGTSTSAEGFMLEKASTYGMFYLNTTTGAYKFVVNDAAVEALKTTQTATFDVSATDGNAASATQTITITLNGANDRPIYQTGKLPDLSLNVGQSGSFTLPVGTFVDPEGDSLTYSAYLDGVAIGTDALDWINFDPATGAFGITAVPSHVGQHTVTVQANDGENTASHSFALEVKVPVDQGVLLSHLGQLTDYVDTTPLNGVQDFVTANAMSLAGTYQAPVIGADGGLLHFGSAEVLVSRGNLLAVTDGNADTVGQAPQLKLSLVNVPVLAQTRTGTLQIALTRGLDSVQDTGESRVSVLLNVEMFNLGGQLVIRAVSQSADVQVSSSSLNAPVPLNFSATDVIASSTGTGADLALNLNVFALLGKLDGTIYGNLLGSLLSDGTYTLSIEQQGVGTLPLLGMNGQPLDGFAVTLGVSSATPNLSPALTLGSDLAAVHVALAPGQTVALGEFLLGGGGTDSGTGTTGGARLHLGDPENQLQTVWLVRPDAGSYGLRDAQGNVSAISQYQLFGGEQVYALSQADLAHLVYLAPTLAQGTSEAVLDLRLMLQDAQNNFSPMIHLGLNVQTALADSGLFTEGTSAQTLLTVSVESQVMALPDQGQLSVVRGSQHTVLQVGDVLQAGDVIEYLAPSVGQGTAAQAGALVLREFNNASDTYSFRNVALQINHLPQISVTGTAQTVVEDAQVNSTSVNVSVSDVDTTDTLAWQSTGWSVGAGGVLSQALTYGSVTLTEGAQAGQYTLSYTLDAALSQSLGAGDPVTESVTLQLSDGQGGVVSKTLDFAVQGTNDAATFAAVDANTNFDAVQLTEGDGAVSGRLVVSDVDSSKAVVVQAGTAGDYGTFAVDANGAWTYTPNGALDALKAQSYTDSFTVVTADGSSHGVTVTIQGVNDAPVPVTYTDTIGINQSVTISTLVSGSTDPEGDAMSVTAVALAQDYATAGSVSVNNSVVTFTPANNYSGPVSISYTLTDEHGQSAQGLITLVVGDNQAPTASDNTLTTAEDTSLVLTLAHFGFVDADAGQSLSAVQITLLPAHGQLLLDGVAVTLNQTISQTLIAAGKLSFVPVANANGTAYASFDFKVVDSGGLSATASNTMTIDVTAVNDAPVFAQTSVSLDVDENTSASTVIHTAQASDVEGTTLSYSLSGDDASYFDINQSTGELTFKVAPNYEAGKTSYAVQVVASDSGQATGTQSLTITLKDVNEAPTAVALSNTTTSLAENTSTTTRVKVADIGITDDALGTNAVTLTGTDASYFEVDAGVLYLKAGTVLNYESKSAYAVTVSVNDSGVAGSTPVTANYSLSLTDVNEAPTAVALSNTTTSLAENTSTTTRVKVADIGITDDALGTNAVTLTGTDASYFEVDAGVLYLKAGTVLNYESKSAYAVTVSVNDSGVAGSTPVTANYSLSLTDVNEAPTAVALSNTTTSLAENTSTTTRVKVADIGITDDALGTNAVTLTGTDASYFEVDAGVLYLKAGTVLNYESKSAYAVTVSVNDSGVAGSTPVTANYSLSLTDVNEAPTAVALSNTTTSLAENTSTTTRVKVADIGITDDALGTNAVTLTGTDASYFEVDAGVLYLKAGTVLNYESKSAYAVTVSVNDSGVAGSTPVTANYSLSLTDVNEAPTAVALSNTTTSLAENTSTTTRVKVADIGITDDALGTNAVTLTGTDASYFEVDAGVLYLKAGTVLNYESKSAYAVTVSVNDSGVAGSTPVTANYSLSLTDVNEAPTAVALSNTTTSLAENTSTTTRVKVADIGITDDALGTNVVTLTGTDASYFEVDAGVLYLKAGTVLNYESKSAYAVTVSVNDSGVAGSTPVTANYSLSLTDVNEAPVLTVLPTATTVVLVNGHDVPLGATLANDFSDPENHALTFSTLDALPDGVTLGSNGSITGNPTTDGTYTITLQVSDGVNTSSQAYTFRVVSHPVVVSVSASDAVVRSGDELTFTLTLSEIATVDTTAGTPTLVLDVGGQTLIATYTSGSGSSSLVFSATASAGTDTSVAVTSLNLNGATVTGDVTAQALDTSTTGITVGNFVVDNTAPVFTSGTSAAVAENTSAGTAVYTAQTSDDTSVSYSLSGTDADLFTLTNGVLKFKASPDFENPLHANSYQLSITATDAAGNTSTQSLTVGVSDVNEAPTAVALSNTTTSLAENTSTATRVKVADIGITDDATGTNTVTLTGTDASYFEVDAGVLYLKAGTALNYETQSSYAVTVSVKDNSVAGSTAVTTNYALSLTDVNESPVYQTGQLSDLSLNVGQSGSFTLPAGTFVDPEGDSLTYSAYLDGVAIGTDALDWINFDPATGAFGITAVPSHVGQHTVTVQANDGENTASHSFALEVKVPVDQGVLLSHLGQLTDYVDTTPLNGVQDFVTANAMSLAGTYQAPVIGADGGLLHFGSAEVLVSRGNLLAVTDGNVDTVGQAPQLKLSLVNVPVLAQTRTGTLQIALTRGLDSVQDTGESRVSVLLNVEMLNLGGQLVIRAVSQSADVQVSSSSLNAPVPLNFSATDVIASSTGTGADLALNLNVFALLGKLDGTIYGNLLGSLLSDGTYTLSIEQQGVGTLPLLGMNGQPLDGFAVTLGVSSATPNLSPALTLGSDLAAVHVALAPGQTVALGEFLLGGGGTDSGTGTTGGARLHLGDPENQLQTVWLVRPDAGSYGLRDAQGNVSAISQYQLFGGEQVYALSQADLAHLVYLAPTLAQGTSEAVLDLRLMLQDAQNNFSPMIHLGLNVQTALADSGLFTEGTSAQTLLTVSVESQVMALPDQGQLSVVRGSQHTVLQVGDVLQAGDVIEYLAPSVGQGTAAQAGALVLREFNNASDTYSFRNVALQINHLPQISVTGTAQTVVEDAQVNSTSVNVSVSDVDTTDTLAWQSTGWSVGAGGVLSQALTYGSVTLTEGAQAGQYTLSYTLDAALSQSLGAGDPVTESVTLQLSDGQGGVVSKTLDFAVQGTNDPATFAAVDANTNFDAVQLTEGDGAVSGRLVVSDVDSSTAVVVQEGTAGDYGTFAVDANGAWTYTPNGALDALKAQSYTDSFTVVTADGSSHGVTVTIQGVNDAPVPVTYTDTIGINQSVTISTLVSGSTDPEGDTMSVTAVALAQDYATAGSVSVSNSVVTFTPANNYSGPVSISYTLTDEHGQSAQGLITLVVGDNQAPTAADNTLTTAEDTTLVLTLADFGYDDTDAGQVLSAVVITSLPLNGQLLLDGVAVTAGQTIDQARIDEGKLTFVPAHNANGTAYATFDFKVVDSGGLSATDSSTMTVNVTAVNDVPVFAQTSVSLDVDENTTTSTVIHTAQASDVENGTTLSYSLSGDDANYFDINQSTGELTFKAAPNYEAGKTSYAVQVVASDSGQATGTQSLTITLKDVNEAPTAISLSASTLAENNTAGAVVATLTATDPDGALSGNEGPFTYALVSGTGDTDNSAFTIVGDKLKLTGVANFESPSSTYSVRIQVTDAGGLTYQTTKTITVSDVNEAPTAITLQDAVALQENVSDRVVVATLSISDPDTTEAFTTQTLTLEGADAASFAIENGDLVFNAGQTVDYESKSSYSVTVVANAGTAQEYSQSFTVNVDNSLDTLTLASNSLLLTDHDSTGLAVNSVLSGTVSGALTDRTLSYNLSDSSAFLNRSNLQQLLDGDPATGISPTLQFALQDTSAVTEGTHSLHLQLGMSNARFAGLNVSIGLDVQVQLSRDAQGHLTMVLPTQSADLTLSAGGQVFATVPMANLDPNLLSLGTGLNGTPSLSLQLDSLINKAADNALPLASLQDSGLMVLAGGAVMGLLGGQTLGDLAALARQTLSLPPELQDMTLTRLMQLVQDAVTLPADLQQLPFDQVLGLASQVLSLPAGLTLGTVMGALQDAFTLPVAMQGTLGTLRQTLVDSAGLQAIDELEALARQLLGSPSQPWDGDLTAKTISEIMGMLANSNLALQDLSTLVSNPLAGYDVVTLLKDAARVIDAIYGNKSLAQVLSAAQSAITLSPQLAALQSASLAELLNLSALAVGATQLLGADNLSVLGLLNLVRDSVTVNGVVSGDGMARVLQIMDSAFDLSSLLGPNYSVSQLVSDLQNGQIALQPLLNLASQAFFSASGQITAQLDLPAALGLTDANGQLIHHIVVNAPVRTIDTLTLQSNTVSVFDVDALGNPTVLSLAGQLQGSVMSFDLTASQSGLNRSNLLQLLDGNPATGVSPTLQFALMDTHTVHTASTTLGVGLDMSNSRMAGLSMGLNFDVQMQLVRDAQGQLQMVLPAQTVQMHLSAAGMPVLTLPMGNLASDAFSLVSGSNGTPSLALKIDHLIDRAAGNTIDLSTLGDTGTLALAAGTLMGLLDGRSLGDLLSLTRSVITLPPDLQNVSLTRLMHIVQDAITLPVALQNLSFDQVMQVAADVVHLPLNMNLGELLVSLRQAITLPDSLQAVTMGELRTTLGNSLDAQTLQAFENLARHLLAQGSVDYTGDLSGMHISDLLNMLQGSDLATHGLPDLLTASTSYLGTLSAAEFVRDAAHVVDALFGSVTLAQVLDAAQQSLTLTPELAATSLSGVLDLAALAMDLGGLLGPDNLNMAGLLGLVREAVTVDGVIQGQSLADVLHVLDGVFDLSPVLGSTYTLTDMYADLSQNQIALQPLLNLAGRALLGSDGQANITIDGLAGLGLTSADGTPLSQIVMHLALDDTPNTAGAFGALGVGGVLANDSNHFDLGAALALAAFADPQGDTLAGVFIEAPWAGTLELNGQTLDTSTHFVQAQDLQAQHLFVDAPLAAGQSLELTLWTLDSRGALGQQQHLYLQVVI